MRAEQELMLRHWPEVGGRRMLDLACGSGRYTELLWADGAAQVVALDASAAMLRRVAYGSRVCASMTSLPFGTGTFDGVISGLALGHASNLGAWMSEVARVLRPGGTCLYSDFHPQAARAGLNRSFTDERLQSYILPHFAHEVDAQRAAAIAAGLTVSAMEEARVGIELREPFPGSETFYRTWHALPLVLVVRMEKS
jgi:malonyl-CoA O-methyltransferase